jgi:hypothetical protein
LGRNFREPTRLTKQISGPHHQTNIHSAIACALLIFLASDGMPVRCYGVDQSRAQSRGGSHNDPGKIVTAAGIEDSSRHPGRKPLTE